MSCSPGADQAAADQASMNGTAAMGNSSAPYTNSTASLAGSSSNMGAGSYGGPKSSALAAAPGPSSHVNKNGPLMDSPSDSESKSYDMVVPTASKAAPSASGISYGKASSMSMDTESATVPTPCSAAAVTQSAMKNDAKTEVPSSSIQYSAEASPSAMAPDTDDSSLADYHGTDNE